VHVVVGVRPGLAETRPGDSTGWNADVVGFRMPAAQRDGWSWSGGFRTSVFDARVALTMALAQVATVARGRWLGVPAGP
jgi:hypothetical protein